MWIVTFLYKQLLMLLNILIFNTDIRSKLTGLWNDTYKGRSCKWPTSLVNVKHIWVLTGFSNIYKFSLSQNIEIILTVLLFQIMILLIIWVAVVLTALTIYLRHVYSKFSRYEVKHMKPVPFLGNMTRVLLRMEHFTDSFMRNYNSFPEER